MGDAPGFPRWPSSITGSFRVSRRGSRRRGREGGVTAGTGSAQAGTTARSGLCWRKAPQARKSRGCGSRKGEDTESPL